MLRAIATVADKNNSRRPQLLLCAVMIVSPSRAHALVDAADPSVSVLYEVLSLPTLRYRLVLVDWTGRGLVNTSFSLGTNHRRVFFPNRLLLPLMLKNSDEDWGPITAIETVS